MTICLQRAKGVPLRRKAKSKSKRPGVKCINVADFAVDSSDQSQREVENTVYLLSKHMYHFPGHATKQTAVSHTTTQKQRRYFLTLI